jgi:hypothetical protein
MVPFRVYDRDNKITWVIINYHPDHGGGTYLAARDDDTDKDRELSLLTVEEISKLRMVDFLDDNE